MRKSLLITCWFCFLLCMKVQQLKAQDQCGSASVETAEGFYNIGRFHECISGLKKCLSANGFNYTERFQAYRLMAMSYLAIDSIDAADDNIRRILLMQDNFEAYASDPNRFKLEVMYLRQVLRSSLISSVSKKAENINLAPATIQIISAADIRNRGYQDVESIFYDLPGFDISRDFGITFSTMYQRGYRSATMTERTLLLVDGVESNEMWTNAAFLSKQFPVSNIKRVEVIYGPASTIYGANAFVGVINIVTKNEDDYFPFDRNNIAAKKKTLAVNVQTGYGSLNTRFIDVNVAKHVNKDVFFSLTGRVYKSDNMDLSRYSNWNGIIHYDSSAYNRVFTIQKPSRDTILKFAAADPTKQYFRITADSSVLYATDQALARAAQLDSTAYSKTYKGVNPAEFHNPINDFYLSGKARFGDFNLGFEYFNKNEGSVGDYTSRFASINNALTNWQVRQFYFYVKYDKALSEKISFSNFTYYRGTDFGNNSKATAYKSYGNQSISFYELVRSNGATQPFFTPTYYAQSSSQFRTEFKLQYKFNEKWDLNTGGEMRTGSLQGDYVKGTTDPAIVNGTVTGGNTLPGGNNYTPYTVGAYTQLNYQNVAKHLNVSAALRYDHNRFRQIGGYGSIFNPRFSVVYYPGNMVFKAIYSEAFMDASSFNKFSTSATRLASNASLQPEKVKNIEFSARYTFNKLNPGSFVEASFYQANYNNTLALVSFVMPNGTLTNRFEGLGKAKIMGVQVNAQVEVQHNVAVFFNFTFTNPKTTLPSVVSKTDSVVKRTGDIADYSSNFGVNVKLLKQDKLNLNLRGNLVGAKPTGKATSISDNPLNSIDGYFLAHLNVNYQLNSWLTVQAGCSNLFNKEYFSPGVRSADNIQYAPTIPQYGRMFQGQLIFNITK
ncbi:TonB-dependent receptor plug domain-containing protein [Sediminibacterium ginsengisoli]|uniref:Outer membrane receptor proteins, mostly Fe transport n=1 Tax=Sediminibacterium ginsengisoli TaxID=413434 RepID=A0A1T4PME8_9BACT|nr:TonB-dependent receptor [Sediminibacterium ginsengisoli]SJZ92764.1 Outer membrane receptor proteins, mostly Fe transport [Sediminibacterium ginsengisoli]